MKPVRNKLTILICTLIASGVLVFPSPASAAAGLYLSPLDGKFVIGQEFTVSVFTNTDGKAINIAETNISFTSDTLELLDVQQGSTFMLPAPGSPNRGNNIAYFGGGLPNPGYSGEAGLLGTMKFKAKASGQARITLTRGSFLLNDGKGTEVVPTLSTANFTITAPPVGEVKVSSPTHDQNYWTKQQNALLNWVLPKDGYGVSYVFDKNATGVPDDIIDATSKTSINYPKVADGMWYFHIKARSKNQEDPFGPVTTYKIKVDTAPPLPFSISLLSEPDAQSVSTTPTIQFRAEDKTSSTTRYDVYVDGLLVKELASSPFAFAKQELGPHNIKVMAYDSAGNGTEAELPVNIILPAQKLVTLEFIKKYLQWPLYGLIVLNLIIFMYMAIILKHNKRQSQVAAMQEVRMRDLQQQIDRTLDFEVDLTRLKRQIDVRFVDMARRHSDRYQELQQQFDQRIEEEINRNLSRIREEINQRLAEAKSVGPRQYEILQEQIWRNLANEVAVNQQPRNATNEASQVRVEVLRRLYEEYTNNKVS